MRTTSPTTDDDVRLSDRGFDHFTRHLDFIALPGSKVKRNIAVPVGNIVIRTNSPELNSGDAYTSESVPEYGCKQFHSYMASPIFCFNNFAAGNGVAPGIGMNRGGQPDRTFSKSGHDHSSAKLYVFADFD